MEQKYFNKWEFDSIIKLMDTNPYKAKREFEEYLNEYPQDYLAYAYYASTLIILQEYKEAEKMLKKAEYLMNQDNHYANNFEKVKTTNENIVFDKLKLLTYQGKYRELINIYDYARVKLRGDKDIESVLLYCQKQIGEAKQNRETGQSYIFRQILEYDEKDFLHHIKKHLADFNSTLDNPNKNVFVPDFPIKDVVKEIRNNIPSDKKLCPGFYDDIYFFKYDKCGRVDNRLVDYIKVVCFHNTSDIITILPVEFGEYIPHVDLNYMVEEKPVKEIKRKSAIEKFNQRFKR